MGAEEAAKRLQIFFVCPPPLFFKVRLALSRKHERHCFVVSEFRESCRVWAHPCGQGPRTAYWGLLPVPKEPEQFAG